MRRKVTLGALTLVAAAAIVLAAGALDWTGAMSSKPSCCPKEQRTSDKPCPFTPATVTTDRMTCPKPGILKEALSLTPEQDAKVSAAYKSFMDDQAPVLAELKAKRAEFARMVIEDNPSESLIAAKADEIASLQNGLIREGAKQLLEVKAVLTPEQQKILAEKADLLGPMCMSMGQCGTTGCGVTGGWQKCPTRPTYLMGSPERRPK